MRRQVSIYYNNNKKVEIKKLLIKKPQNDTCLSNIYVHTRH